MGMGGEIKNFSFYSGKKLVEHFPFFQEVSEDGNVKTQIFTTE